MKITPRLTALILGLSLVPMGLLSVHYNASGKAALRQEVLARLASSARHLEQVSDEEFKQSRSKLALVLSGRSMSRALAGYRGRGDSAHSDQIEEALARVRGMVPELRSFAFLDTAGSLLFAPDTSGIPSGEVLSSLWRKDWRRGMVHLWVPDSTGLSLYMGGPVHSRGRLVGMGVARADGLDLRSLAASAGVSNWQLEPVLFSVEDGKSMMVIRKDGKGAREALDSRDALHRPEVAAALFRSKKDTLITDRVGTGGKPALAAVHFLESAAWGLSVEVAQEQAFAPVERFRNDSLLALLVVSLAAVVASLMASRRLTRPLLELITLAREFSAGHLARRSRSRSRDELGELSRSLDSIAENLVSRRELQNYIDQMSTLSVKLDLEGRVLTANRAFQAATGKDEAGIIGRPFLEGAWLHEGQEAAERMQRIFEEAKAGEVMHQEETMLVDGRIRSVHFTFNPMRDQGGAVDAVIAEGRDITALKDAQAALYEVNEGLEESVRERTRSLQGALREKDMLLREIHHRVKNNLQIISSLLSLQSVHVRDPHVAGILTESRNRVKSMALVHERLYAGDDLGKVGFSGYIRDLAAQLVRSSDGPVRGVNLEFELEDIPVGLTQAIPCGLSIHELVANCLKHAFPDGNSAQGGQATVIIRCRPLPAGGFELEVEDNGRGLPEGFDPRKSRTLGLQLVFTLVKQLKGVLEVDRGAGTRVRIAIPGLDEREEANAV